MKTRCIFDGVDFTTLLFSEDQVIIAQSEDKLQKFVYIVSQTVREYNKNISLETAEVAAALGVEPVTAKIIVNEKTTEQASTFKYLGSEIPYRNNTDA